MFQRLTNSSIAPRHKCLVILRNSYDRNTKNKNRHRNIASPIPAEDLILTEPNSGSEDISGILDECIRNLRQAVEEIDAAPPGERF
jgi:hypothetical protein